MEEIREDDQSREMVDFATGAGIAKVKIALEEWQGKNGNTRYATGRFGIGGYHNLLSPSEIREAMKAEIDNPTIYPNVKGWKYARTAVASRFSRVCKVEVDPSTEVSLACGGREVLVLLSRALIKRAKGRRKETAKFIVSDPCYGGQHRAIVEAGGTPLCLPCGPNDDYYGAAIQEINEKGEEIIAVFVDPIHNPTGFSPSIQQLTAIAQAAESAGVVVIGDEVYRELVHEGQPLPSMLELMPHKEVQVAVIESGSKIYAMSRDRIGDLVGSEEIIEAFVEEREVVNYGPPSIIQAGYAAGLELCDYTIPQLAARIGARAKTIFEGFRGAGWKNFEKPPTAGIFQLSDIPEQFPDALTFCVRAAREYGLEIWPAWPFGHRGNKALRRKVRIPYVEHEECLPEAFDAMKRFLERV
jgi:aspartate/methionine/tyrosine aminotransferase